MSRLSTEVNMKLSSTILLSVLLFGASFAVAQNPNHGWNNHDGSYNGYPNGQYGQYNRANTNDPNYQRGFQDGINSGRADANQGKRFDVDAHPYYRNSNNQAYREGFMQGYRGAYGQGRGNNGYNNNVYNNNGHDNDGHDNDGYDNDGYHNGPYNTANNPNYQRGFQDGINSGRADANQGKRFDVDDHPYYRNSNNQVYREGFMQGYRDAYGQARGNNGNHHGHGYDNH